MSEDDMWRAIATRKDAPEPKETNALLLTTVSAVLIGAWVAIKRGRGR